MPLARAPCVMTWKPEGNASAETRKAATAAARPRRRRGTRTRRRCLTLVLPRLCLGNTHIESDDWHAGPQSRPPRRESQRNRPASRLRIIGDLSHESELPTRDGSSQRTKTREAPVNVGTILGGRYRIDAVLGFGGMGVVYRARDLKLDQEIALKRIRPDRVSSERRETLRREIILSRRVTHPNVCRVYDLTEIGGEEFVSMEYIAGQSLKDLEERERMLPLGRGLAIA